MFKSACIVSVILTVAVGCVATGRGGFLDATTATVSQEPADSVEFEVTSPASESPEPFPLRVHLLATDRAAYRRMETLIYDVRLINVSDVPVVVPWSTSPIRRSDRATSGYRHALFELRDVSGTRPDFVLDSFVLYGSPNVPKSLNRLAPGESVVVRVPAALPGNGPRDATNPVFPPAGERRVRAGVYVYGPDDPRFRVFHEELSNNTLPVRIMDTVSAVPAPAPYTGPPEVVAVSPVPTSPGTVIRLEGYRLGVDREPGPEVHFLKDGVDFRGEPGSASYVSNDRDRGRQYLGVTLPEAMTPGEWQIVVDVSGRRSDPFHLSIGERTAPPRLDRLFPETVNPGGAISIRGAHFRPWEAIEVTDARGRVVSSGSSTMGDSVGFSVPADTPDGEATVHVRAMTAAGELVSNALLFVVTSVPLPLEIQPALTMSVGPGQWTDLSVTDDGSLHWSQRTEVEFHQNGTIIVVATTRPDSTHVQVPRDLAAGPVNVRTRTWRSQKASHWSEARIYHVAPRAVPAVVEEIQVGPTHQSVVLTEGPEKPTQFEATPGDDLILHGRFPVSDTGALRITLDGRGRPRRLASERVDDYSVRARLPRDLRPGSWQLVIRARGMPAVRLPIVMQVSQ